MRRLVGVGCAALSIVGAVAALVPTPACTNHECDPPPGVPCVDGQGCAGIAGISPGAVQGDPNAWESSPLLGTWLHFPAQITYSFDMNDFPGREVVAIGATLAVSPDPADAGTPFVPTSQEAAEFTVKQGAEDAGLYPILYVFNDTCSEYWIRIFVTFAPAGATDGGADASDAADETSNADAAGEADAAEDAD